MAARGTFTQAHFVPQIGGRAIVRQAWGVFTEMVRARQTRRMLAEMDDRMLADIDIGRGDAQIEAARAPWDLVARRR